MNPVVFSRKQDDWETPQALFDLLNKEFHFTVDAAANAFNTKCIFWYTDSLTFDWPKGETVWLNPPYSKIGAFIKKAWEEAQKGATVVCLIPSRTDTKWWHEYVMKADEIWFIKGRLKFTGGKYSAPFPSCIVIFRKESPGRSGYMNPYFYSLRLEMER